MPVISDAEYSKWEKSPTAIRVILVEAKHSKGIVLFSTRSYISATTDTKPNRYFEGIIKGSVKIVDAVDKATIGDIDLINDGSHTDWFNLSWRGFPIKIYLGDARWSFSNFRIVANGIIGGISAPSVDTFKFSVLNSSEALKVSIGREISPVVIGKVYNIRPVLINAGSLIYKVSSAKTSGLDSITSLVVRDNGVVLVVVTDYTVDLVTGEFTLVSAPAGQITCDVEEVSYAPKNMAEEICRLSPIDMHGAMDGSTNSYFTTGYGQVNTDIKMTFQLEINHDGSTFTTRQCLLCSYSESTGRGYRFLIEIDGSLGFDYGTDALAFQTYASLAKPSWAANTRMYLKFERTSDDGKAQFFSSDDGVTWDTVGILLTGGVGSTGFNNGILETIGTAYQSDDVTPNLHFTGRVYHATITDLAVSPFTKTHVIFDPSTWIFGTTWTWDSEGTPLTWNILSGARVDQHGVLFGDLSNIVHATLPQDCGLYIDKPTPTENLLRELMNTVGGSFSFNLLGKLEAFIVNKPNDYTELNNHPNAITAVLVNETNVISNLLPNGFFDGFDVGFLATAAIETVINDANEGLYSIFIDIDGSGGRYSMNFEKAFDLIDGVDYELKIVMRHSGTGDQLRFALAKDDKIHVATSIDILVLLVTDTTFIEYTYVFTHAKSEPFLGFREDSIANKGGVYIARLSIKEKFYGSLNLDENVIAPLYENGMKHLSTEEPIKNLELGFQKNWNVQSADSLAGAVSVQDRDDFSRDHQFVNTFNLLPDFPMALSKRVLTIFRNETDTQDECDRRQLIRVKKRNTYLIKSFVSVNDVKIGDEINISYPGFLFFDKQTSMGAIVLEVRKNIDDIQTNLVVWI
ncbi:MAG: hypothetical protein JKY33_10555 [Bacteroidia bacterium]|nr:hypothetical protein [Bacteroidia bacterium]